jgi:hypothetical protein
VVYEPRSGEWNEVGIISLWSALFIPEKHFNRLMLFEPGRSFIDAILL